MLLSFDQVEKSYFDRKVLDGVTFRVDAGVRVGLIGHNGSGKSTLLKLAEGLETPDAGTVLRASGVLSGYLSQDMDTTWEPENTPLYNGELALMESNLRGLENTLSVTQDHGSMDHRQLLEDYAMATARFETLGGYDFERTMRQTLEGLGLSGDILERPVSSLSGGERMRVRLARILIRSPDLLLLDEPTNHLDMTALEWLEDYIRRFRGAVIVVSHDRAFLDQTVDTIAELSGGHMRTGAGNYSAYMAQKKLDVESRLREIGRIEKEMERQRDVAQTMLSHRKMSSYHAREKVVRKLADTMSEKAAMLDRRRGPSMKIRFLPDQGVADTSRVLIRVEGLSMSFGDKPLFQDVRFSLRADERIALVGPNGCGKTTLLRILLGEETALSGQVWLSGAARMGYMGQFATFADENHTILREAEDATGFGAGGVRSLLARFGFRDTDLHKRIAVLSGGERARLYLCLMLENQPDLLLLDEPTNHLDIESREILESALLDFPGAILAVSHDRYFISKCCHAVLGFIADGVSLFYKYDDYRRAVSSPASGTIGAGVTPLSAVISDDAPEPESSSRPAIRASRAEGRRQTAAKRELAHRLEASIQEMEAERFAMERAFDATTLPETYDAYAALIERIDQVYEEFLEASEED